MINSCILLPSSLYHSPSINLSHKCFNRRPSSKCKPLLNYFFTSIYGKSHVSFLMVIFYVTLDRNRNEHPSKWKNSKIFDGGSSPGDLLKCSTIPLYCLFEERTVPIGNIPGREKKYLFI